MSKHEIIKNYCKRTGKEYDMVVDDAFRLYLVVECQREILRSMSICPELFCDFSGTEEKCRQAIFEAVKSVSVVNWEFD
ncbi:hypothetical protein O0S10_09665 [Methanocorpusculum sp. MG]|uniref:HEPN domain-containing protein n=1 Tax=Methanocorpusculum petauri TaxID=3002863 RepID=A0ABT4IIA7_9EURY|nr:hypothetical protein [Methanocorpusculum petauri]MCZ0861482.1 hypothetical protein [Methanocorpusculum petauri]